MPSILQQIKEGRMRGPAAAIAVPAAVGLISAYMAKKGADKQADALKMGLTPSPEELMARRGTIGSAGALGAAAPGLMSMGTAATGRGAGYYSALLGSRPAMQAAVAPAAANITQNYEGAQRAITPGDRSGGAGLLRQNLERDKVGQVARLTAGVQPQAAGALAELGQGTTGQGLAAAGGAGSLYGNLATGLASARLGTASGMRGVVGDQNASNQQTGQGLMGILQGFMNAKGSKPAGG